MSRTITDNKAATSSAIVYPQTHPAYCALSPLVHASYVNNSSPTRSLPPSQCTETTATCYRQSVLYPGCLLLHQRRRNLDLQAPHQHLQWSNLEVLAKTAVDQHISVLHLPPFHLAHPLPKRPTRLDVEPDKRQLKSRGAFREGLRHLRGPQFVACFGPRVDVCEAGQRYANHFTLYLTSLTCLSQSREGVESQIPI